MFLFPWSRPKRTLTPRGPPLQERVVSGAIGPPGRRKQGRGRADVPDCPARGARTERVGPRCRVSRERTGRRVWRASSMEWAGRRDEGGQSRRALVRASQTFRFLPWGLRLPPLHSPSCVLSLSSAEPKCARKSRPECDERWTNFCPNARGHPRALRPRVGARGLAPDLAGYGRTVREFT